ncbi:hypothetical protein ACFLSQ_01270 [Bacteroidota bacterium]
MKKSILIYFLFVILSNISLTAQSKNYTKNYWINFGSGICTYDNSELSVNFNLVFNINQHIVALQTMQVSSGSPNYAEVKDYSIMYGRSFNGALWKIAISGGVGLYKEKKEINHSYSFQIVENNTLCIPVVGQVLFTPLKWIGIGAYVYANYNPINPYIGANIIFSIGKINY